MNEVPYKSEPQSFSSISGRISHKTKEKGELSKDEQLEREIILEMQNNNLDRTIQELYSLREKGDVDNLGEWLKFLKENCVKAIGPQIGKLESESFIPVLYFILNATNVNDQINSLWFVNRLLKKSNFFHQYFLQTDFSEVFIENLKSENEKVAHYASCCITNLVRFYESDCCQFVMPMLYNFSQKTERGVSLFIYHMIPYFKEIPDFDWDLLLDVLNKCLISRNQYVFWDSHYAVERAFINNEQEICDRIIYLEWIDQLLIQLQHCKLNRSITCIYRVIKSMLHYLPLAKLQDPYFVDFNMPKQILSHKSECFGEIQCAILNYFSELFEVAPFLFDFFIEDGEILNVILDCLSNDYAFSVRLTSSNSISSIIVNGSHKQISQIPCAYILGYYLSLIEFTDYQQSIRIVDSLQRYIISFQELADHKEKMIELVSIIEEFQLIQKLQEMALSINPDIALKIETIFSSIIEITS